MGGPMSDQDDEGGFLSRWSRRKLRRGEAVAEPAAKSVTEPPPERLQSRSAVATGEAVPALLAASPTAPLAAPPAASPAAPPAAPPAASPATPSATPASPPPTLADVAVLTRESDFARFVAPGVDAGVKNAALKKLFTDPHFNLMDGLDTYIDDYGQPDPLPAGMLRQMVQSKSLGLFSDDPDPEDLSANLSPPAGSDPRLTTQPRPDEYPDLRLQPHDDDRPPGLGQGLGADAGREHGRT
jgi:hypothetical protein